MLKTVENCMVIRKHYEPAYTNGICEGVKIDGTLLKVCAKCYLHDMNNARKICKNCGKEFISPIATTRFCSKECSRKHDAKVKKLKNTPKKQTLDDVLAELNEYNRTHGTHLTYGKYQAMKFNEALKNEKNRI